MFTYYMFVCTNYTSFHPRTAALDMPLHSCPDMRIADQFPVRFWKSTAAPVMPLETRHPRSRTNNLSTALLHSATTSQWNIYMLHISNLELTSALWLCHFCCFKLLPKAAGLWWWYCFFSGNRDYTKGNTLLFVPRRVFSTFESARYTDTSNLHKVALRFWSEPKPTRIFDIISLEFYQNSYVFATSLS